MVVTGCGQGHSQTMAKPIAEEGIYAPLGSGARYRGKIVESITPTEGMEPMERDKETKSWIDLYYEDVVVGEEVETSARPAIKLTRNVPHPPPSFSLQEKVPDWWRK